MDTEPPPPLEETYTQEDGAGGARLILPWQGRVLNFRQVDWDLENPENDPRFLRKAIYMQVIDPQLPEGENLVTEFQPPLTMIVEYTPADLDAWHISDPEKELVLAIYNHVEQRWEPYDGLEERPDTVINPSGLTGEIQIGQWTSHACWYRR